ncbi:MAG: HupE/UreJ family protein [Bacteroidota bacterium]
MSIFELYLRLGISHIADFKSYDHILFIITLCSVYPLKEWKRILILITAFTIGHSLTLLLATLGMLSIPSSLVEFLIPLTIFITAVGNIAGKKEQVGIGLHLVKYGSALFFGLIHGLGFSNYLHGLLGAESSILLPLFSFNVGIEIGQIIIVSVLVLLSWIFTGLLKVNRREWNLVLAGAGLGISLILMSDRFPW